MVRTRRFLSRCAAAFTKPNIKKHHCEGADRSFLSSTMVSLAATKKTLPQGSMVAKEKENVFIPLDETVAKIRKIIASNGTATFIRAGVATGKSTLANYMAEKYPDEFVLVEPSLTEEATMKAISNALNAASFDDAVDELIKQEITLMVDEGHILFRYRWLVFALFKKTKRPNTLLFSAASDGLGDKGETFSTPPEIEQKYMWTPPMPDAALLAEELRSAGVNLDAASVEFLLKICAGHYGIFMKCMKWVQLRQQQCGDNTAWDITRSVAEVRSSFEKDGQDRWNGPEDGLRRHMRESRAIRVHGDYSEPACIPDEFAQVLFEGPKSLGDDRQVRRRLTINGLLLPERRQQGEEFVALNWDRSDQIYKVAATLMADYYDYEFARKLDYSRKLTVKEPATASDLVARTFPLMNFMQVVDTNPSMVLSDKLMPYEDAYKRALAEVLKQLEFSLSQPNDPTTGKPDIVVVFDEDKTCVLELVMATRGEKSILEHAARFEEEYPERLGRYSNSNYSAGTLKGLVIIGSDKTDMVRLIKETTKAINVEGLELIGLCVSVGHDAYEMYVSPPRSSPEKLQGPFLLPCDRNPRSLEKLANGNYQLVSACKLLKPGVDVEAVAKRLKITDDHEKERLNVYFDIKTRHPDWTDSEILKLFPIFQPIVKALEEGKTKDP